MIYLRILRNKPCMSLDNELKFRFCNIIPLLMGFIKYGEKQYGSKNMLIRDVHGTLLAIIHLG